MPTAGSRSRGVSRETIETFSTRRAEIEAAMEERGLGTSGDNPRLAERASLMTRAKKRDIDRGELRGVWERQAADLGLDARALVAGAAGKSSEPIPEAAPAAADPATEPDKARETAAPVFASERLTGALLDRITHHVHILEMNGESYRLKQSRSRRRQPSE